MILGNTAERTRTGFPMITSREPRLTGLVQERVRPGLAPEAAAGWAALPGVPESVAAARHLVSTALEGCPRLDDLVLAVSELATNAVAHSASGEGGMFLVRIRRLPFWARIEVWDGGPASVPPAHGSGYGLPIVREVTDRCGTNFNDGGRRTAWAECTWTP
jgi:signal transduction histidine kinase